MASRRVLAETRDCVWLLTLWPTKLHRDRGGLVLRASNRCLSNGAVLDMTDASSRAFPYPPMLVDLSDVEERLSMDAGDVTATVFPDLTSGTQPYELGWGDAWGEVARIDENATGSGPDQDWEEREIFIRGPASVRFGANDEPIQVTIHRLSADDSGTIYPSDAALSSDRFGDVSSTADRDRAQYADGELPPIPIGPGNGIADFFRSPMMVVQDEDDAGGSALGARRWLVTYEQLSDTATGRDVELVHPSRPDRDVTGTGYTGKTVSAALDLLGDRYLYVGGQWEEPVDGGAATSTFDSTITTVTTRKAGSRFSQDGDQMKADADANTGWRRIDEIETARQLRLVSTPPTTRANVTASVIRTPAAQAYGAFVVLTGVGGIVSIYDPSAPMSSPPEVIEWALRRSRMNVRIAFEDLRTLTGRCRGWHLTTVLNRDSSPWSWVDGHVLPWVPIVPYLQRGVLRFYWDGPAADGDVVAALDVDGDDGVFRLAAIHPTPREEIVNRVRWGHGWSVRRERVRRTTTVTGEEAPGTSLRNDVLPAAVARASQYRYEPQIGCAPYIAALDVDLDTIDDRDTAALSACHLIWRRGRNRPTMDLAATRQWRWLRPGDVVEVLEVNAVPSGWLWRVVAVRHTISGDIGLTLQRI